MLSFSFNPYTWDSSKERVDFDVVTLQLKNNKGELIKVSNLSEDIVIITPLKPGKNFTEKAKYFTRNDNLLFHEIEVRFGNTLLMMEINPQAPNVYLFAYMRFGQRPTSQDYDLNATISHDEKCVWMLSAHDKSEGQTVCSLNPHAPIQVLAERPGKYFLGLKNYNATLRIKAKRSKVHACESPQQVKAGYNKKNIWALEFSEVEKMRRRQAKKQNLSRYFTELGLYLVFVFLLLAVCYGNRSDHR